MRVDCQANPTYTTVMSEILKNVHVTTSLVTDLLEDPRKWLEGLDGFEVRYVGGLHNLSHSDKKAWTKQARGPLRIVETGSGREEVWFPTERKVPSFVSLDKEGNLTSHFKNMDPRYPQPAVKQDCKLKSLDGLSEDMYSEFCLWYRENVIHNDCDGAAVVSSKLRIAVPENEMIAGISINVFREFWRDGEWADTHIDEMSLVFHKTKLNGAQKNQEAIDWIAEHCQGGFFPFEDPMFRDPEEEFLFLTDICSRG